VGQGVATDGGDAEEAVMYQGEGDDGVRSAEAGAAGGGAGDADGSDEGDKSGSEAGDGGGDKSTSEGAFPRLPRPWSRRPRIEGMPCGSQSGAVLGHPRAS
jgi:hypothetical protein